MLRYAVRPRALAPHPWRRRPVTRARGSTRQRPPSPDRRLGRAPHYRVTRMRRPPRYAGRPPGTPGILGGSVRGGPAGEAPLPAHVATAASRRRAEGGRGDDEQLVAAPQRRRLLGDERGALAHDEGHVGARRAGAARRPGPRRGGTSARRSPREVRADVVERCRLEGRSNAWWARSRPSRCATQGSVGAWTSVNMMTRTKTRSKIHSTPAVPEVIGTVASTTGTAPRSPAHDRNPWVRHPIPKGVHDTMHRQRPGEEQQDEAEHEGGDDLRREAGGVREQPEHDEEADLREPAEGRREPGDRRPVREPHVAEHERGEVAGDEPGGVDDVGRGVREHRHRHDPDREQRRRAAGDPCHEPAAEPPDAQPDRRADDELEGDEHGQRPPRVDARAGGRPRSPAP